MKSSLENLKQSFHVALQENPLREIAPVLRSFIVELGSAAKSEIETMVQIPTTEGRVVTAREVKPETVLPMNELPEALRYKPTTAAQKRAAGLTEKKKRKPRKMTPAQLKKLAAARDAYFKKKGFGKYAKKKNGKAA